MIACPPDDRLRMLLAGDLAAEETEALARHTDGCADCQRRLEALSADPGAGAWRRLLEPDGAEPAATRLEDAAGLPRTVVGPPPDETPLLRRLHGRHRAAPPPAPPGYEILGELGRGGMGVVYKARQTALKRLVALKVIGTGGWAGPQEIARFCAEAEAVARLQHPNVVQIYETGDYEGRPFFSLEYVEGGNLAQRLGGKPLAPRDAAELVCTLALAMHAAHQRGIVHRDLKPANVLLQAPGLQPRGLGTPKIADFGLAKRLGDESGLTQTGMIVGTPSYMAPEQARGQVHEIGPPADVYALGAILYECLTGRPPFNGATALDTLEQVRHQTPVAPGRLQPTVPRDTETICLKCLEKEPARRYAGARDLADDLERFLTGRPIKARPATPRERAWKWARRRPAVAGLLAALAAALLVLVVVGVWSYWRVTREAARRKEQAEFAQQAVEDMYSDVAADWLAEDADKNSLQKKFLDRALSYYRGLAADDAAEPAARRRTARAFFRMGQLHRMLDQPDDALAAYQEAIDRQGRLRDEFPADRDCREELAETHNWRGELLRETEKSLDRAEQDFRTALALEDRLAREAPREPRYRRALARGYSNLALVEMDTRRRPDARGHYDEAIRLLDDLVKGHPENAEFRHELARTLTNRGFFHCDNGDFPPAEEDFGRAIDELKRLRLTGLARTTYAYNLAIAYQDMGHLRLSQRRYDGAREPLLESQKILVRLVEDFPDRPRYRKKQARTCLDLGTARAKAGDWEEAESHWQEARTLLGELVRAEPGETEYAADLGRCLGNLGWLRLDRGRPQEARPLLEEAARHLGAAHEATPGRLDYQRDLQSHLRSLTETLVRLGDRAAAVKAADEFAAVYPDRPLGYYYAACFVARCAAQAEEKHSADDADQLAGRAASLLRQALDKGLRRDDRLADDGSLLGPLASRPEFAGLLDALKALPPRAANAEDG